MKITSLPNTSLPPEIQTLVNHVNESVIYQVTTPGVNYPEWLIAGAGRFIIGQNYQTVTWINNDIEAVLASFPESEGIQATDSPLLTAPNDITGHVLLLYIDETYGENARKDWLQAIFAQNESLDDASEQVLDISFETLNEQWLLWLADQF